MATDSQTAANQLNSQKCTGPTSAEGKTKSSQNALKTGLYAKSDVIATENRDEYETLIAEYQARFNPATPEERCLVDDLIRAEWLGRRYMAATAAIWECDFRVWEDQDMGLAFIRKSEAFGRAQRCITATQRNYANALKQLQAIQSERAKRAAQPVSDPASNTETDPVTKKLVSFPQPHPPKKEPPQELLAETAIPHPQTEDSPPIAA